MININDRLHSTAVDTDNPANNHVVASAAEIFDDTKGKQQSAVNQEVDTALADRYTKEETYSKSQVYTKDETYNKQETYSKQEVYSKDEVYSKNETYSKSETYDKTELNSLITTPDVGYVTVTATDQTTSVTDLLPSEGSGNTIYRVAKWDGTQYDASAYTEYGWDGSRYLPLGTKNAGIDAVPTAWSNNLVESGGVYDTTNLCNIPEVNDFVVDIVLKDGMSDPDSDIYVDISAATTVLVQCCSFNSSLNKYQHSLQVKVDDSWKGLFYKSYDTLEEAKGDLGKVIEGSRCYAVLRYVDIQSETISKTLQFSRDVTWKSLNEHSVIKGLFVESEMELSIKSVKERVDYSYEQINGYTNKNINQPLTVGEYWHMTAHTRYSANGFVSNDVTSCEDGDVFIITGKGGDGESRLYVFSDANGNNISVADGNEERTDYSLVAPEGAVYFYFTAKTDNAYNLQKVSSYGGVLNELTDIRNDINKISASNAHGEAAYNELYGGEVNPDAIELENGYYWFVKNTPPTLGRVNGWACNPAETVPCEAGDTFILTGEGGKDNGGGPNSYLWAFANSNGVIIRHAEVNEKRITPFEVIAQQGEVQFYMSSFSYINPTLFKKTATKGLLERTDELEADVSDIKGEIDKIDTSVSKMFNTPINLKKPNLKVLDLGNSYTDDATHYLGELLNAANITSGFSLYTCIRGGSSFRTWVNMYNKADNANYGVSRKAGDVISGIAGGYSGLDNTWFVNLLKQDWDVIVIHQESVNSTNYEEWTGDGSAGGLTEYIRILKTYCPQAAIGFYIIHSYPSWRTVSYQGSGDSSERWWNIANSVKKLKADYGIDFIIPYGTAVQNLRLTSINPTDPVDTTKKNDFSADGTHLTSGIGDYVAACSYFESLFAPRYNITVLGNTYTNDNIPIPQPGDEDYYDGRGVPVQITTANALLAQRSAILAVNDMFSLSNPEEDGFIPSNSDTRHVYSGDGNPSETYSKEEIDMLIAGLR